MGKIVLVDGFKIRNTLDDDFGVLHTHDFSLAGYAPKFYIPPGEIWIDHRFADEANYLQEVEAFFASEPEVPYEELRKRAAEKFCVGERPEFIIKTEEQGGTTVRFVDGAVVRRFIDPEFIFGGHDLVYPAYIPHGEIWLDAKMDEKEAPYVLHHEVVERQLMTEGKPYHIAHEYATVADKELRRKDGASYPGDPDFPWRGLTNDAIIKQHYVV